MARFHISSLLTYRHKTCSCHSVSSITKTAPAAKVSMIIYVCIFLYHVGLEEPSLQMKAKPSRPSSSHTLMQPSASR